MPTSFKRTPPDGINWSPLRFLIVEDNEDHQRLMSVALRDTSVKVVVVGRGEEAIDLVKASFEGDHAFDLILMDIRLPTIDGYETTRQVRAAGYTGPIVAVTARVMDTEIEECQKSGCDVCVSKPFDRAALRDTIAALLAGVVSGSG